MQFKGFIFLWRSDTRSRWPRGLRRRCEAACLLLLPVRIPAWAWFSIFNIVCCQIDVCDWPIPRPGDSCEFVCLIDCDRCSSYPLHLQIVGRRRQTKKDRIPSYLVWPLIMLGQFSYSFSRKC